MSLSLLDPKKICFHCSKQKSNLTHCEIWNVFTCKACQKKSHEDHHKSCEKASAVGAETEYFDIQLTRYDGQQTKVKCRKGYELPMEPHWAGTYLFHTSGLLLVKENKDEINRRIVQGLRSIAIR